MLRRFLAAVVYLVAPLAANATDETCHVDRAVAAERMLETLLDSHTKIFDPIASLATAQALLADGEEKLALRRIRQGNPADPKGAAAAILAAEDKLEEARKLVKQLIDSDLSTQLAIAGAEARLNGKTEPLLTLGRQIVEGENSAHFQELFRELLSAGLVEPATEIRDAAAAHFDIPAMTEQMDAALDAARLRDASLSEIGEYVASGLPEVRSALALRSISADRAAEGEYDVARLVAEMILRPDARALALTHLADVMPSNRDDKRRALLEAALADLESDPSKTRPIRFTVIAMIHARLGHTPEALAAADRALRSIKKGPFEATLRVDALAALAAAGGCVDARLGMQDLPEAQRLEAERKAWINLKLIADRWR